MQQPQHYETLVRRYLDGTASQEELTLFFHLLQQGELDAAFKSLSLGAGDAEDRQPAAAVRTLPRRNRFWQYAAAASVVLLLAAAAVLFVRRSSGEAPQTARAQPALPQAAPGTKKATLTLSNGQTLALGSLRQTIRDENATVIPGTESLVYNSDKPSGQLYYNTITTPAGGEYRVTLPDGTDVWLNAGTSLRYPTAFSGAERRVSLNGEAYFEVAKNPAQPFVVEAGGTETKVLGTHFNVMAYADEAYVKTTLAEGAVVLRKNGREEKLRPGEGGTMGRVDGGITVVPADVEQDLAWKNGNFSFNKTELPVIMKQLARWYDLEIRYAGTVPEKRFVGRISRNTNLSEVLAVLRLSDVKFSMNGRTLVVEE